MKKRSKLIGAIYILCAIEIAILIFSFAVLSFFALLSVIIWILCFFLTKYIVKLNKKQKELKAKIKAERNPSHKAAYTINEETIFAFVSPFPTEETVQKIVVAFSSIGTIKNIDKAHGYIKGRSSVFLSGSTNVDFYIEKNQHSCKVTSVFKKRANDDLWDIFLKKLFENDPDANFGVSLANGTPYVLRVLYLGSETETVINSTSHNFSSGVGISGNNLLFGSSSGKTHTQSRTHEDFANRRLVRLIYNNGRIWEGHIRKGTKQYNEIMINS